MIKVALVSDAGSLPIDFDMSLLLGACSTAGLEADVCFWNDPSVEWSTYSLTVLRSPWSYVDNLPQFLDWCTQTATLTRLLNPISAIRWSLDKRYLRDLEVQGVPVVPSFYARSAGELAPVLRTFMSAHSNAQEFVVKPAVGAYSKDVRRFSAAQEDLAAAHLTELTSLGDEALIQPYFPSIDRVGETDLIYFDGEYSHAIRKRALLLPDGTTIAPTQDTRQARDASSDERAIASAALDAAARHLKLDRALLYGRVDLIPDDSGAPMVLELELCEPSLSLPFAPAGAGRFASAIASRLSEPALTSADVGHA